MFHRHRNPHANLRVRCTSKDIIWVVILSVLMWPKQRSPFLICSFIFFSRLSCQITCQNPVKMFCDPRLFLWQAEACISHASGEEGDQGVLTFSSSPSSSVFPSSRGEEEKRQKEESQRRQKVRKDGDRIQKHRKVGHPPIYNHCKDDQAY